MAKLTVGTSVGNALSGIARRVGLPAAPVLGRAPVLDDPPRTGRQVGVDPGIWAGTPVPTLALQWLRDGTEIPGAIAARYTPSPRDAQTQLSCRVTATNAAGTAQAVTPARTVDDAAPRTVGGIPDLSLIQNSGVHSVTASNTFSGTGLRFGVTGEGVTIDPETGTLAISTETLRDGIEVTVTATNTDGTAEQAFRLRVAAEPAAQPETPVAPVAVGALVDVTYTLGSGTQTLEAAAAFAGANLGFEATGAGIEIDAATGTLRIPTEAVRVGETVRVTATNAGGAAEQVFRVTIEAAEPEPEPQDVPALAAAAWSVEAVRDPILEGAPLVGMIRILDGPGLGARQVYRTSLKDTEPYYPGHGFEVCVPHPDATAYPNCWLFRSNNPKKSFHIYTEGDQGRTVVRWSPDDLAPEASRFSPDSDAKTWHAAAPAETPGGGETGGGETGPVLVAPALLAIPVLVGEARIGEAVEVAPGSWSGTPAPELTLQWQLDGVDVAGATGARYAPVAADDGGSLACVVTASSPAGTVQAVTAALKVTHVAPTAKGELFDEVFDEGTGVQSVETAADFEGAALRFAVAGAGAEIDPDTGTLRIPTEVVFAGETVTVTATNSGGSASSGFQVTIEAAEPESPEITALAAAAWSVEAVRDPILEGAPLVGMIRILDGPGLGARQVFWTNLKDTAPYYPGHGFEYCVPHPDKTEFANCWLFRSNNPTKSFHVLKEGTQLATTLRWSPDDLAPEASLFSPDSDTKIWRVEAPAVVPAPQEPVSPPPDLSLYRLAPYVTEAQFKTEGYIAGDAGQYMLDAAQSESRPDLIITGQDMGGIWASLDHGNSWYNLRNRGLSARYTTGVAIDPVDPRRWFAVMHSPDYGNYARDEQGLYVTSDGGLTWMRTIARRQLGEKIPASTICHAPSTKTKTRARRWYCVFSQLGLETATSRDLTGDDGFFMSDDGGDPGSWTRIRSFPYAAFGHPYGALVHPTRPEVVFVWGSDGLFRFNDAVSASGSVDKLSGRNGLPAGRISGGRGLYIAPDGQTILLGVANNGVYWSTDGGKSFTQVHADRNLGKWHVNPWNPDRQMITYGKGDGQGKWSRDGGKSFTTIERVAKEPGDGGGDDQIDQGSAHVFWHPTRPERLWAHGRPQHNQSDDGGKTWRTANAGFNGRQHTNFNADQMFDPKNADRFAYFMVDFGYAGTQNRGRWFTPAKINRSTLGIHGTVNGGAIHPDPAKGHILLSMNKNNGGKLLFSKDGITFVVADNATEKRWYIGFDYDDPRYAFQWRQKSSDHGETWSFMSALPSDFSVWGMTRFAKGMPKGQAIFAVDVNGSHKIVRRSLDRGASWPVIVELDRALSNGYGKGGAFRVHPSDPDTVFTRTNAGHVVRRWSLAAGKPTSRPFEDLNVMGAYGGSPPDGMFDIGSLAIDPRRPEVMYVMNNYDNTPYKFFRTTNGGRSWDNITEGFSATSHGGLEVSPVTGEVYMAGGNGARVLKPPYPASGTLWDLNLWGNRYIDKPY